MWRSNTGVFRVDERYIACGIAGQADITGLFKDGTRLEIEVKRENGKQSKTQAIFQKIIQSNGGVYILARSPSSAVLQVICAYAERHGVV